MINPLDPDILSLADAAKRLPRFNGRRVHVSTIWRWASHGLRGIRLETTRLGGRACTSLTALRRFFDALSDVPDTARHNSAQYSPDEREQDEIERSLQTRFKV